LTSSSDESSQVSSSGDDPSDCHSSAEEEEDEYFEIPVIVNIFRDNCHNSAPVCYVQNLEKPRIPVRKPSEGITDF
jgi:hypothetical protein